MTLKKSARRAIAVLATAAALLAGGSIAATANAGGTPTYVQSYAGGGVDVSSMKADADCYGSDTKVEWIVRISPLQSNGGDKNQAVTSEGAAIWLPKYVKDVSFAVTDVTSGYDLSAMPSIILQTEKAQGNPTPEEAAKALYKQLNADQLLEKGNISFDERDNLKSAYATIQQKAAEQLSKLNIGVVHPQGITAKVTDASAASKWQTAVIDGNKDNWSLEDANDSIANLDADTKAFVSAYAKEAGISTEEAMASIEPIGYYLPSQRPTDAKVTSSQVLKNDVNFTAKGLYGQMSAQEKAAYDIYTFAVTSQEVTIKVTGSVPKSIIHAGTAYVPLRATNKVWRCNTNNAGTDDPACMTFSDYVKAYKDEAAQATDPDDAAYYKQYIDMLDSLSTGALPAAEQKTAGEVKAAAALQTPDGMAGSAGCVVTKNSLPNRIYADISKPTAEGDTYVKLFYPWGLTVASVTSDSAALVGKNDARAIIQSLLFNTDEDGCDQAAAEVVEPTVCVVPTPKPKTPKTPKTPTPKTPTPKTPTPTLKTTPKAAPVEQLASTGADVAAIGFGALALLALGGAALVGARKKRS